VRIGLGGAGLAGLAAARERTAAGHEVVVWGKARGVGGRTSTRRGPDGLRFDHGAPVLHDGDLPLAAVLVHATAHRWRLSRPGTPLPDPFLQAGTLVAAAGAFAAN
jgi:monoamine oxidase